MSSREPAAAEAKSDRFPPGIPFIVGNEGAERFSYYGMRAVLYVYLAALYVQFVPEASSPRARRTRRARRPRRSRTSSWRACTRSR
ncbi:MAG: hypothetical protein M5U28_09470 [Sandaracinaceae bacterium]|nr:hypothetical protein [Sandaracinaceae bacterium]